MTDQEEFLCEVLDLFKSKLKNGACTKAQTDAVYNVVTENMPILATADELAQHYGKTKQAIFSVIKRRLFSKPKRNVTLYSFCDFNKQVPSSWHKKR